MPPQAIFAATCHVTPLATAPDLRNTVLGPVQSGKVERGMRVKDRTGARELSRLLRKTVLAPGTAGEELVPVRLREVTTNGPEYFEQLLPRPKQPIDWEVAGKHAASSPENFSALRIQGSTRARAGPKIKARPCIFNVTCGCTATA